MTKLQIGTAVKKAREAKKYTFYKVGKLTNTNPGQIVNLEDGTSSYTIDLLIKICKVLGVSVIVGDTITIKTPAEPKLIPQATPKVVPQSNGRYDKKKPASDKSDRLRAIRAGRFS